MRLVSSIRLGLAACSCAFALMAGAALAQGDSGGKPVPTMPGASSAGNGGFTSSAPSTAGSSAIGPLEPYLVTLLIPVFGVVIGAGSLVVDRKLRAQGHG